MKEEESIVLKESSFDVPYHDLRRSISRKLFEFEIII